MEITKAVIKAVKILFVMLKSAWDALYTVVWGMVSFFLLAGLIIYFKADPAPVITLLQINAWLMQHWEYLMAVLFIYFIFSNYNDLKGKN
jgi:hypothetical protein